MCPTMGNETYQKRQKELARQQKQGDKRATLEGEDQVTAKTFAVLRPQNY